MGVAEAMRHLREIRSKPVAEAKAAEFLLSNFGSGEERQLHRQARASRPGHATGAGLLDYDRSMEAVLSPDHCRGIRCRWHFRGGPLEPAAIRGL